MVLGARPPRRRQVDCYGHRDAQFYHNPAYYYVQLSYF